MYRSFSVQLSNELGRRSNENIAKSCVGRGWEDSITKWKESNLLYVLWAQKRKKRTRKKEKALTKVDSGNVLVFFFPFVIKLSCCWEKSPVFLLLFSSHIKAQRNVCLLLMLLRKWGGSFFFAFSFFRFRYFHHWKIQNEKQKNQHRVDELNNGSSHTCMVVLCGGAAQLAASRIGKQSLQNAQHNSKEMEKQNTKQQWKTKANNGEKLRFFSRFSAQLRCSCQQLSSCCSQAQALSDVANCENVVFCVICSWSWKIFHQRKIADGFDMRIIVLQCNIESLYAVQVNYEGWTTLTLNDDELN